MLDKAVFVTGTRADFGKMLPLATWAQDSCRLVNFFATGMHLQSKYGGTVEEVRSLSPGMIFEFMNQSSGDRMDQVLTKTTSAFADFLLEEKPDLVFLHGDRVETLACAIACVMNNFPVAHIEGGEVSGTIDESIRHATSKLAHLHFVCSEDARKRLLLMGEDDRRIFVIGSPELDLHRTPVIRIEEVRAYYEIGFSEFGIVSLHPVTTESDTLEVARNLFSGLRATSKNYVVILPNNDPGSAHIFNEISQLSSRQFKVIPSMRFSYFSTLMHHASIMIGNSSAGVREAPFIGLPSINIGSRQNRRTSSPNVVHLENSSDREITEKTLSYWGKKFEPDFAFGTGDCESSFKASLTKLAQLEDLTGLIQKYFTN